MIPSVVLQNCLLKQLNDLTQQSHFKLNDQRFKLSSKLVRERIRITVVQSNKDRQLHSTSLDCSNVMCSDANLKNAQVKTVQMRANEIWGCHLK